MTKFSASTFLVFTLGAVGGAPSATIKTQAGPQGKPVGLVAFKANKDDRFFGIRDASGKVLIPGEYDVVEEALSPELGAVVVHRWWGATGRRRNRRR